MISNFCKTPDELSALKYSSSADNRISVSNSLREPEAMYKKCKNSFLDFLAAPSAMLHGTETPALLIWDIIPYFSSAGNDFVTKYNSLTREKLSFQTFKFFVWSHNIYV